MTDLAGSLVTSCRPPGRLQKRPDDRTWNAGVAVRTAGLADRRCCRRAVSEVWMQQSVPGTHARTNIRTDGRTTRKHNASRSIYRTHTHPFNDPFSGTTRVSRYQKGKANLDFSEARDSEWQWHQLGNMQVFTSLQTDNHTSTPPLSFLQAGCPSCRPTNSVKALKAQIYTICSIISLLYGLAKE